MMPSRPKLTVSISRMLLLAASTFILLSVHSVAEESRRCYWCGPLAEQVHRSRRAPPCDGSGVQVTACEAGLTHCAVVATSPPHVESRYCVKLYQDECYALYCNSTKTWKMTCPCQGDLCNGPNTQREIEAFTILSKLVTKTHNTRIRKRTALSFNFLNTNNGKSKSRIVTIGTSAPDSQNTSENGTKYDDYDMQSDQPANVDIETENINEIIEQNSTILIQEIDDYIAYNNDSNVTSTPETIKEATIGETKLLSSTSQTLDEAKYINQLTSTSNMLEAVKTKETLYLTSTTDTFREAKIRDMLDKQIPSELPVITLDIDKNDQLSTRNIIKPSVQLPAAEALQQNVSQSVVEKTTEQTTAGSKYTKTQEKLISTTPESMSRKNNAVRINKHVLPFTSWIILSYYI